MTISPDRWTCPSCNRTVVIDGCELDVTAAIAAVQDRHARGHEAAAAANEPPRRRRGRNLARGGA